MSEVEARGQFVIESADKLPAGKVVHVEEHEGSARIHYAKGHASQELCDQLNAYHVGILEEAAQWKQDWTNDADRLTPRKAEQPIATARYVLVPGAALPRGRVCFPVSVDGEFIWLVHDEEEGGTVHMSPEAIVEMNEYLDHVVGNGLWKQQD